MRKYEFIWEKKRKADHERSYESHRKHFLKGDLATGWKPRAAIYEFPTFEEYQQDMQNKVTAVVEPEIEVFDPNLEEISIRISGTKDYTTLATYHGTSRDGKKVKIGFNLDLVVGTFYPLIKNEHTNSELSLSTAHEIRHHLDREIIRKADQILFTYNGGTLRRVLDYLTGVRIEGLAQIDPREPLIYPAASWLKKQTMAVDKVLNFLKVGPPEPRVENGVSYPQDHNWNWDLNKLIKAENFSKYVQGRGMFAVICEAEEKKKSSARDPANIVFKSEETCNELIAKARSIPSFREFYDYYYDCARQLDLTEDQMIIRPSHISPLLEKEKSIDDLSYLLKTVKDRMSAEQINSS